MRLKYALICVTISILLGIVFWILDGVVNFYIFHENLRFLLLEGPESVVDSILFRISPRELISRTVFLVFSILAGLLMAVFIIREKEKDAALVAAALERQRVHERLKSAEEKFSKVFLSSPAWMLISLLETGEILEVNNAFLNATGYDKADLIGRRDDAVGLWIHRKDRDRLAGSVTEHGAAGNLEIEIRDKQGDAISALCSGEILTIGGRQCLLCAALDLREIKDLEDRLQQAQKMESIGNLAGGIAHDFNNILFPIVGMAELLMADLPPDTEVYENTEEILKAGKRGTELVRQIMAFSRQTEHRMIPVHVQQVLREVMMLMRATIPTYIELEQDIAPDCGMILADPTQVHQVALNIITNAYHAVESGGGKIRVELNEQTLSADDHMLEPGRYVVLSISDTGHGMSAAITSKIFEPYFTTKEKGKGTGLGLAVAYGIIKEHRGDIKVYSEKGRGTTFRIFFPRMETADRVEPSPETGSLETGNETILLVDDEESVANLEKKMLERLGYRVTSRVNSAEALSDFRASPDVFDMVISDMSMPGMTGDQLTRELKKTRPDIPVIICTGFSERINKENAEAIGVNKFLMKPIVISDLASAVRQVLDEVRV